MSLNDTHGKITEKPGITHTIVMGDSSGSPEPSEHRAQRLNRIIDESNNPEENEQTSETDRDDFSDPPSPPGPSQMRAQRFNKIIDANSTQFRIVFIIVVLISFIFVSIGITIVVWYFLGVLVMIVKQKKVNRLAFKSWYGLYILLKSPITT